MKNKFGFTLIEILVSLAAFSLVMVSMGTAFYKIYNDWQRQRDYNLVLENGRWAMEFMSNEIRSGAGEYSFADSAETGLVDHQFLSFESTPSLGAQTEKVYYWRNDSLDPFVLFRGRRTLVGKTDKKSGKTINRNLDWVEQGNGVVRDLCRYVVNDNTETFAISDCDASGNCTVAINLTVRPRPELPEGPGNRNFTFRTRVRPRN